MPIIEKTNEQLTWDVSTLMGSSTSLTTTVNTLAATDLTITSIPLVGLKDGSGTNGDIIFKPDSSIYIKIAGGWYFIPCASLKLGV